MGKGSIFNNIIFRNLIGLIFVFILLIITVLYGLRRYTQHGKAVEVPDVSGLLVEKAESFFTEKNLIFVVVDSMFVKTAIPGTIVETTPPVGSKVKQGRTIYLKINAYMPNLLTIPEVIDTSQRHSIAMLRSLGFEKIEIKLVPGMYRDLVMGIESKGIPLEAGQRVPANTPVSLLVSTGSGELLFLENPVDSVEDNSDESWF